MKTGKRNYKDALFRDIFKEPSRLTGLYEALEGTAVSPDEITLATIDETLFSGVKNDVSFFVRNRHVLLAEHQSTINANMPLRLAMYLMEIYRQYVPSDAMYQQKSSDSRRRAAMCFTTARRSCPTAKRCGCPMPLTERKGRWNSKSRSSISTMRRIATF